MVFTNALALSAVTLPMPRRIQALETESKKREMRLSCVDRVVALRF